MKNCILISLVCAVSAYSLTATAQEARSVPNQFSANTPAVASEVNENFAYLSAELDSLDASSVASNLDDGWYYADVDCSSNPDALAEAYAESLNYANASFALTGDCYGEFRLVRHENGDLIFNDEFGSYSEYQIHGQSVSLYSAEGQRAKIVPHPTTNSVGIWVSFGGGLYLNGLDIEKGSGYEAVFFGRNSHGDLTDVSITGSSTDNGVGVVIQEGAQAYLIGVSLANLQDGVMVFNDGTLQVIDSLNIDNVSRGVVLHGGSVRQNGEITITNSTNEALNMTHGSRWIGWDQTINAGTGDVWVNDRSVLQVGTLATTGALRVNGSTGYFASLSARVVNAEQAADVYIDNAIITERLDARSSGVINFNGTTGLPEVHAGSGGTVRGNFTAETVTVYGGLVDAWETTINGPTDASQGTVFIRDSALNGELSLNNTKAEILNTTLDYTQLNCSGTTSANINSVDLLNEYPDARCLAPWNYNGLFDLLSAQ